MTFEEQFPSLSQINQKYNIYQHIHRVHSEGIIVIHPPRKIDNLDVVYLISIMEHCLDRQKVREAILHITSPQSSERVDLLKELGL